MSVHIAKIPDTEPVCKDFSVRINGESADLYTCRVSAMPYNRTWPGEQRPLCQTELASFLSYQTDGLDEIELTAERDFDSCVIRPLSKKVLPTISGRTIRFTLPKPGQYTVELDGENGALHIFANPQKDFGVKSGDENVLYYGKGTHHPGAVFLEDNQTVFIDDGAVVYGSFIAINKKNIRVCGYGVIDGSYEKRTTDTLLLPFDVSGNIPQDTEGITEFLKKHRVLHGNLRFYRCENVRVEGVICRDSSGFAVIPANCVNTHIDNIKTIGMWRYNSDGIDLFNCRDALIENCFLRDFDDCMVLKGIKGWDKMNMENITVRGCVIWCDWGRALEIGAETCADEYRIILFENCDIIRSSHIMMDIQNGDRAIVHDCVFRDIRCEYTERQYAPMYHKNEDEPYKNSNTLYAPKLIEIVNYCGMWSLDNIFGNAYDVTFENISVYAEPGVPELIINIRGADSEHIVHDITVKNLTKNSRAMVQEDIHLKLNEYVASSEVYLEL